MSDAIGHFALAVVLLLGSSTSLEAGTEAILAGAVVDVETGTEKLDQVILIESGKIIAIGPHLAIPKDANRIDLSKETILPGLFDAHTHLCATVDPQDGFGNFLAMALQQRSGWRAIEGVRHAREMLDRGFTTVRDVGNAGDYVDMDVEKAIRLGLVPGPTILPAGRIIAPFGGQFWQRPMNAGLLNSPEYRFADTQDEMRKAVRENIYWGARVIKIAVDVKPYAYSSEDIEFIVREAARAGLKVAAHVETGKGARAAIQAGVASVEHGFDLSDEDLALMKKNNVSLVSTDLTVTELVAAGMESDVAQGFHNMCIARLKRAWAAGVNIVFGTDIMADVKSRTRGELAIEYVDSFAEAGIPPLEILRLMTTRAAVLLGVEKERGAIRVGLAADLVATRLNPLRDITGLKKIDFVMKNGTVHRLYSQLSQAAE
jgi:imidazolonepropionase-like amidohydrolase